MEARGLGQGGRMVQGEGQNVESERQNRVWGEGHKGGMTSSHIPEQM